MNNNPQAMGEEKEPPGLIQSPANFSPLASLIFGLAMYSLDFENTVRFMGSTTYALWVGMT
jgi:hypothetical protein